MVHDVIITVSLITLLDIKLNFHLRTNSEAKKNTLGFLHTIVGNLRRYFGYYDTLPRTRIAGAG